MNSNKELVQYLIDTKALHSGHLIEAFLNVDRADFAPKNLFFDIYGDYPLQIGEGQTISQPTTVAMMLEMLEPLSGHKILDIGSGSGWTTALLAYITKKDGYVLGLERIEKLVSLGISNLSKYNFPHASIKKADDSLGVEGEIFDRILVSAAAEEFPVNLTKQLKIEGKLVIPVNNSIFEVTKISSDDLDIKEYYGFRFVPLIYNE